MFTDGTGSGCEGSQLSLATMPAQMNSKERAPPFKWMYIMVLINPNY